MIVVAIFLIVKLLTAPAHPANTAQAKRLVGNWTDGFQTISFSPDGSGTTHRPEMSGYGLIVPAKTQSFEWSENRDTISFFHIEVMMFGSALFRHLDSASVPYSYAQSSTEKPRLTLQNEQNEVVTFVKTD